MERDVLAAIREVCAQALGGEFATSSRDFGRGAAEVVRRIRDVLPADPDDGEARYDRSHALALLRDLLRVAEAHHPAGVVEPYFCRECGETLTGFDGVCPALRRALSRLVVLPTDWERLTEAELHDRVRRAQARSRLGPLGLDQ